MKILLTNYSLSSPGGSETFLYSLACQLRLLNHHVELYSPRLEGIMYNRFRVAGFPCHNSLTGQEHYDIIHIQHHDPALDVLTHLSHIPIVYTSLGVLPIQEHPPAPIVSATKQFIAVSEEVKAMLINLHGIPEHKIKIIRNGIDVTRFRPLKPPRRNNRNINILINDRYPEQLNNYIALAGQCRKLPFHFSLLGHYDPKLQTWLKSRRLPCRLVPPLWNVEKVIQNHDIVIGLGRSALEGMACGKPVIVYRPGQADGIVTRRNIELIKQCNLSGRYYHQQWSPKDLIKAINWVFSKNRHLVLGKTNRSIVVENFNIAHIAHEFCAIYQWAATNN
ncbi:MAG: glycosyltransferase family 4 protein [Thermincolia bacterium]